MRSAASAPWMSACDVRWVEASWSTSWRETACESSSFCARASSLCASSERAFIDVSCACARAASASNGRGSIENSRSPFLTSAPSLKCTLSIVPATRGRSSTYSAASSRPLNSSLSATARCTAGATLTGGACGGPPCASASAPQPVMRISEASSAASSVPPMSMRGCARGREVVMSSSFSGSHPGRSRSTPAARGRACNS